MTFLSAYEDFCSRTLASLPTGWMRLVYVAGLRHADGSYRHWGLQKIHGDAAQHAIHDAHVKLFADVLSTPVSELSAEVLESSTDESVDNSFSTPERLLPATADRAAVLHLASVTAALDALRTSSRTRRSAA